MGRGGCDSDTVGAFQQPLCGLQRTDRFVVLALTQNMAKMFAELDWTDSGLPPRPHPQVPLPDPTAHCGLQGSWDLSLTHSLLLLLSRRC